MQVYNSGEYIEEALDSFIDNVEKIIIVDGPWKDYPHKTLNSTDKTRAICESVCGDKLIWIGCKRAWKGNTAGKLNAALKYIPKRSWFLHMGSDEILKGIPLIQRRPDFGSKTELLKMTPEDFDNINYIEKDICKNGANRLFEYFDRRCKWGPRRDTFYIGKTPLNKVSSPGIADGLIIINNKYRQTLEQMLCGIIYRYRISGRNPTKFINRLKDMGFYDEV